MFRCIVITLTISASILAACSDDNKNVLSNTSWKEINNPRIELGEIIFYPNGEFRYEHFYGASAVSMLSKMDGTYEVFNETGLTLTITRNSDGVIDEKGLLDSNGSPFKVGDVIKTEFNIKDDKLSIYSYKLTADYIQL